jgi:hypothetical protein
MSEGIKLGYEPYSYNPVTMWRQSIMDMQKLITFSNLFKDLKKMGMIKFVRKGTHAPEGFVSVDDSAFKVYFPTEPGLVDAGEYFVEEGIGRLINNYLGKDVLRASAIGQTLLQLKNVTTMLELAISPFHAMYESGAAIATDIGVGAQRIWNSGDIAAGLKKIITAPMAPVKYSVAGGRMISYVKNPEEFIKTMAGQSFIKAFPDAKVLIGDMFTSGARMAIGQDYKFNSLRAVQNALRNYEPWAFAINSIPAASELLMKPIFEVYIPRIKIGAFLAEFSQALRQNEGRLAAGEITKETLGRQIWTGIENRFGEMNFDNLFWNRNFKTAMQIAIRSVTWKVGALNNLAVAAPEQIAEIARAAAAGRKPQLKSNFAYLLGVAFMTATVSAIIQKLGRGEWPQDIKDLLAPRYNKAGDRVMLNTHLKDWIHVFHSPAGFVTSSLAGEWGRAADVIRNKDFFGNEVYNEDDPTTKKIHDSLKHLFPTPFSISNTKKVYENSAPAVVKGLTMAGVLQPTPQYITDTPAEALAKKYMGRHVPVGGRTQAEADRRQARKELREKYAATHDEGLIAAAHKNPLLTNEDILNARLADLKEPIANYAEELTLPEVFNVIKVANPEEKLILLKAAKRKFMIPEGASMEQRARLLEVKAELLKGEPDGERAARAEAVALRMRAKVDQMKKDMEK